MHLFNRNIWGNDLQFDQIREIYHELEEIRREIGQTRGLWTPGFTFGGSATGITYTVQVGKWFKQGTLVICYGVIQLSNNGSGVGQAVLTGLPFTAKSDGAGLFVDYTAIGAALDALFLSVLIATKTAPLTRMAAGATAISNATDTDITNTFSARILLIYETDED